MEDAAAQESKVIWNKSKCLVHGPFLPLSEAGKVRRYSREVIFPNVSLGRLLKISIILSSPGALLDVLVKKVKGWVSGHGLNKSFLR